MSTIAPPRPTVLPAVPTAPVSPERPAAPLHAPRICWRWTLTYDALLDWAQRQAPGREVFAGNANHCLVAEAVADLFMEPNEPREQIVIDTDYTYTAVTGYGHIHGRCTIRHSPRVAKSIRRFDELFKDGVPLGAVCATLFVTPPNESETPR